MSELFTATFHSPIGMAHVVTLPISIPSRGRILARLRHQQNLNGLLFKTGLSDHWNISYGCEDTTKVGMVEYKFSPILPPYTLDEVLSVCEILRTAKGLSITDARKLVAL